MHLYVFGSLCRGEIDTGSDVDLLAITLGLDSRLDPDAFAIYSYSRIRELWEEGNPFAWHLALEARMVFTPDGRDFLREQGSPAAYSRCAEDCRKFARLFGDALDDLKRNDRSGVFELSNIFLAVRNLATCFSLGVLGVKDFSRHSARHLGQYSLKISDEAYRLLERSRILSTRGVGQIVQQHELQACLEEIFTIGTWVNTLLLEVDLNGRVQ